MVLQINAESRGSALRHPDFVPFRRTPVGKRTANLRPTRRNASRLSRNQKWLPCSTRDPEVFCISYSPSGRGSRISLLHFQHLYGAYSLWLFARPFRGTDFIYYYWLQWDPDGKYLLCHSAGYHRQIIRHISRTPILDWGIRNF
jgi:hypothetical protein